MGSQWDSFHKEESAIFILSLHASCQWATFKMKHIPHMRVYACVCAKLLSHVRLFAALWTVTHQAPLSMGFPRQEY